MTTAAEHAPEPAINAEQQSKFLATGQLFHTLAADPRYRKRVLGLIKEASPDTPIPELDLESAVTKTIEERLKPQTDEAKKLQDRLDAIERRQTRDEWAKQHDLSEEEVVEIEELAKKEQIGSGAIAVELWKHRQALGTPRNTRRTPPGAQEFLEKLSKVNPRDGKRLKAIAQEEATRIFSTANRKAS